MGLPGCSRGLPHRTVAGDIQGGAYLFGDAPRLKGSHLAPAGLQDARGILEVARVAELQGCYGLTRVVSCVRNPTRETDLAAMGFLGYLLLDCRGASWVLLRSSWRSSWLLPRR